MFQIKNLVDTLRLQGATNNYIINAIKEHLQLQTLNYIYNSKGYNQNLIFTGGTCLRFCFNLPRLSEDLDFDYEKDFSIELLKNNLENSLKNILAIKNISSVIKGENKKIYFKFPILDELSLSFGNSNILYLKVEPTLIPIVPKQTEITALNKDNLYFFIKRYSLADLMAGKIHAFLTRSFFKGKNNEIDFKGRDIFDLIWYMGQNITPNIDRLKQLLKNSLGKDYTWQTVLDEIKEKLQKIKKQHIVIDIQYFIENEKILNHFLENYLKIFKQYYQTYSKGI